MVFMSQLFTFCTPEDPVNRTINEPAAAGGWTIMIWLDGDNDLEWSATEDFNELEYGLYMAGLTDPDIINKVKIIVQIDRRPGIDPNSIYTGNDWTDTRRYIIRPDSAVPETDTNSYRWTSQRIDNDMGEVNMGDAVEVKDFIEYCQEHFPADNYALILWNHGGGLMKKVSSSESDAASTNGAISKNICTDDTDDDQLYTGEITDVLTDAHSVEFLGFDACLMGMIEVAYEYRPGVTGKFGADAICFSPASEQGDGWDYVRILTRLGGADSDSDTADTEDDPCYDAASISANEFATLCAKEYADAEDESGYDTLQTQTAVDNTLVDDVKNAMDAFAAAIAQVSGYKSYIEAIRGSGSSTVTMNYFSDGSSSQWISWPFFDLYDFAKRVYNHASLNDVDEESLALMTAIKAFILYSYGGSGYTGFTNDENGLSFFFTDGDAMDASDNYYLQYQWWYTSLDTNSVMSGYYYGKIDFCEKGSINGTVENWYELIMHMYMAATGLTGSKFWPSPAY